jgi:hypothetical protein
MLACRTCYVPVDYAAFCLNPPNFLFCSIDGQVLGLSLLPWVFKDARPAHIGYCTPLETTQNY